MFVQESMQTEVKEFGTVCYVLQFKCCYLSAYHTQNVTLMLKNPNSLYSPVDGHFS